MDIKDIIKLEKELAEYKGEDQVVAAQDLYRKLKDISNMRPEGFMKSNFPTMDNLIHGFWGGELTVISGPTKMGKCHGKGTMLLMYDGTIKAVEDIEVGDLLMGDDSRSRKVLSTTKGYGKLFNIVPHQGNPYVVNGEHILCLQRTKRTNRKADNKSGLIIEIPVDEYQKLSKSMKHILKTYRVPADFYPKQTEYDPYMLGLWLGDGTSTEPEITTADKEIKNYLDSFAQRHGFYITEEIQDGNASSVYRICDSQKGRTGSKPRNRFKDFLTKNKLINNKHIPWHYKCNSRNKRLRLLAGLIDTDGNYRFLSCAGGLEFYSKSEVLATGVAFLCRSLGYATYMRSVTKKIKSLNFEGQYWRVCISGDLSEIPCLLKRKLRKDSKKPFKNVLRSGFKITPNATGNYYGFTLDGNGRYLLSDFQVTHNTTLAQTLTVEFAEQDKSGIWFTYEVPALQFLDYFPALPAFYMPSQLRSNALDWLYKRVYEAKLKFGLDYAFIDHLHYLIDMNRHNISIEIGHVMRFLKKMAIAMNIHIFLIAHLEKIRLDNEPDETNLRDSSFVGQECDNCFMIWRKRSSEYNEAVVKIVLNRRFGVMGKKFTVMKIDKFLREVDKTYDE
jgi:replicative DNA helicase